MRNERCTNNQNIQGGGAEVQNELAARQPAKRATLKAFWWWSLLYLWKMWQDTLACNSKGLELSTGDSPSGPLPIMHCLSQCNQLSTTAVSRESCKRTVRWNSYQWNHKSSQFSVKKEGSRIENGCTIREGKPAGQFLDTDQYLVMHCVVKSNISWSLGLITLSSNVCHHS